MALDPKTGESVKEFGGEGRAAIATGDSPGRAPEGRANAGAATAAYEGADGPASEADTATAEEHAPPLETV